MHSHLNNTDMSNQRKNSLPLEEDLSGEDLFKKLSRPIRPIPERNMTPEEISKFENFFRSSQSMEPDMIPVDKMLLLDIIDRLENSIASFKEELVQYDKKFKRKTRRDKIYTNYLENEIRKITNVRQKTKSTIDSFYEKENTKNSTVTSK